MAGQETIPYRTFSSFLRTRFGTSVRKVPLDAGFSCPNRDGTRGVGGCTFCDAEGGSGREVSTSSALSQLREVVVRTAKRHPNRRYLAYLQSFTNTYAPVESLRPLYLSLLAEPRIVGLVVGTRPDMVPDDVLELLAELNRARFVSVELGIQSLVPASLAWLRRGHDAEVARDALRRARSAGLFVCAHVILGIPGEGPEQWRALARELGELGVHAVKLHMLYVVRGTLLADLHASGELSLLTLPEYAAGVADFLEHLPPDTVIERLTSDPPAMRTLAPDWLADKQTVLAAVRAQLARRGTRQGSSWSDATPGRPGRP